VNRAPFLIFGAFAIVCLLFGAKVLAGAGSEGNVAVASQDEDGKELFISNCGPCHTLAAAGTDGSVGPNLDDLEPDAARVLTAIQEAPGVMPEGLAEGAEAQAIADYVAGAAGKR
jgi:mono/diheme cytochrome c family protein